MNAFCLWQPFCNKNKNARCHNQRSLRQGRCLSQLSRFCECGSTCRTGQLPDLRLLFLDLCRAQGSLPDALARSGATEPPQRWLRRWRRQSPNRWRKTRGWLQLQQRRHAQAAIHPANLPTNGYEMQTEPQPRSPKHIRGQGKAAGKGKGAMSTKDLASMVGDLARLVLVLDDSLASRRLCSSR